MQRADRANAVASRPLDWIKVKWMKATIAVLLMLLCILAYVMVGRSDAPNTGMRLVRDMAPDVILLVLAYLVGNFLLFASGFSDVQQWREGVVDDIAEVLQRTVPGVEAVYKELQDVDWPNLFRAASEVTIVSRFCDGIITRAFSEIIAFFKNGGRLRLFTMDPNDGASVRIASTERNRGNRGTTPRPVRERILDSIRQFNNARELAGASPEQFSVYLLDHPPNYAAYCIDDLLIMNPSEHFFDPRHRAPRIAIRLGQRAEFESFWKHEISEAVLHSRQVTNVADLDGAARSSRATVKGKGGKRG